MDNREALKTFMTGENFYLQHYLGAHREELNGEHGYTFRVWAPNAQAVHLVGDFTNWIENQIPMVRNDFGVWEVFTNMAQEGHIYKYHVTRQNGHQLMKIDPFAVRYEARPGTGAIVTELPDKKWRDGLWLARRKRWGFVERPVNIYEVHAGSWKRNPDGSPYSFAQLKDELIPYLVEMNYTHIEFMPLMSHPLGLSWGYQLMGYFALEHAYGRPEEFQDFVEECHTHNIGVIVDWVPGHFTINDDALAYYDGTPTFEYQDHNKAHNHGWGALNFDLGKNEVQSFLISCIKHWIDVYHLDGIRVDAVSNMLYLDYDNAPWTPNKDGGNLNYEGYYFLQRLNEVIKLEYPDVMMIAEESSSATKITGMKEIGGLGFDYKWNMGWMNDILRFYEEDPIYRKYDFNLVTFSFMYVFKENYLLPFSHDEVVHGKKSMMHKMWGDRYNQFAGLRNLYTYQICHPGKKLLFMGSEYGQFLEWKSEEQLEWSNLEDPMNAKMKYFTSQLNQFYKDHRCLWEIDTSYDGIEIIDADNRDQSVLSFIRKGKKGEMLVCIFNMVPVERKDFTIGLPVAGIYEEVWNTELEEWGGVWKEHNQTVQTQEGLWKDYEQTLTFTLPAMGAQEDLSGKAKNKAKLQERVGLPVRADVPLVGIVSRLTRQKGFDVVVESLHHILQEDVQIVLLGTGDPAFEGAFSWFAQIYPDKLSTNITFDVKLAQEIYAACDLFLMPSRFEPCGLSQMMAMRYGTLPLVHEVGGLRDTVRAFNPIEGSGTGFSFDNLSPYWLNWTFQTALDLYRNHPDIWRNLQKQAMESDFSWDTACKSYLDLYHSLVN